MFDTKHHYYLHHKPTKTLVERLSWTQFNGLCRIFRTGEWADYNVWIAERDQWFKLTDMITEILKDQDGLLRKPPTIDKNSSGKSLEHQLIGKPVDNRLHERFYIGIPVMVDIVGSIVNTQTKDFSFTGFRLENPIPTRRPVSHCFFYIKKGEDLIEFKVAPFYDNAEQSQFDRVKIVSCNELDLWKDMILKAKKLK